jgi:hypothetical protein
LSSKLAFFQLQTLERPTGRQQNWAKFKTTFAIVHQELRKLQLTPTSTAGFQSAIAATTLPYEIANAIANLATATATDCMSVAALTGTISQLAIKLSKANAKLLKLAELATS